MVIEVRRATLEDLPGLVPIQRETKDFHLAADPTFFRAASDDELREAMREFLSAEQTVVFIACIEGIAAGFLVFKRFTAAESAFCHARDDGLVEQLAVAARFRRRGVGRALIAEAERFAASQGCRELRLGVLVSNAVARRFYASLAFTPQIERWRKHLQATGPGLL